MTHPRLAACCILALGIFISGGASAQAVPPRSILDITALLDEYKPDVAAIARLQAAAAAQPPTDASRERLKQFYWQRSRAAEKLGNYQQRVADLRKARELSSDRDDDKVFLLGELSNALVFGGNALEALEIREEQSRLGTSSAIHAHGFGIAAVIRAELDLDLDHARRELARAEQLFATLNYEFWRWWGMDAVATVEHARSRILNQEGRFSEAETAARKAVEAALAIISINPSRAARTGISVPDEILQIVLQSGRNVLAVALRGQGKLAEAEVVVRSSLHDALRHSGRYSVAVAWGLNQFSNTLFEQGRYADAQQLAVAAAQTMETLGAQPESWELANARRAGARAMVAQDKPAEALEWYERMQAGIARDAIVAERIGQGDVDWAYALVRGGQAARGVQMLTPLLERRRAELGAGHYLLAELHGFLAIALSASGRKEEALKEFAKGVPILLERVRTDRSSRDIGPARSARLKRILDSYIALLATAARSGAGGEEALAEAFRLADVARDSFVQRALTTASARAAIRDPELAKVAREEQDLGNRIGALSDILVDMAARPVAQQPQKIMADIRRDIDAFEKQRVDYKRRIGERYPEYANLVDPKPVTLNEARARLRPGEALISIYFGVGEAYAWVVAGQGPVSFAVVPMDEATTAQAVSQLREALDVGVTDLARFPAFDLKLAHALYERFLLPVEAGWRDARTLLIAPHGPLGQLPFALLPTEASTLQPRALAFEAYRDVPWLLRKAAVVQLPSVNTFVALRAVQVPARKSQSFAGFGDPDFGRSPDGTVAALRGSVTLRNLSVARLDERGQAIRSAALRQLPRLPDTAEEITNIARILQARDEDVFLGRLASESNVKGRDLSDRSVIAFATHGLVPGDLDGLTQPALALSNPEVTGEKDADGLLSLDEILALKLNADWILLSACNTAAADGAGAEAVSGLGRAFFYAGARALLVSNWPVETVSAKLLTNGLFKRQAEDPKLSRTDAFRQAMLDLLDRGVAMDSSGKALYSYAHPMFWAPFSLVGEGTGR